MSLDQTLSGRTERRLPIIVVVCLASVERAGTDGEERTYTDNISARGARIFSRHPWQPGGEIMVTPRNEETTCGNVVYCERLDDRYAIGVKFQDYSATWSAIRKYDGIHFNPSVRRLAIINLPPQPSRKMRLPLPPCQISQTMSRAS